MCIYIYIYIYIYKYKYISTLSKTSPTPMMPPVYCCPPPQSKFLFIQSMQKTLKILFIRGSIFQ